jgi:hypothetical protein
MRSRHESMMVQFEASMFAKIEGILLIEVSKVEKGIHVYANLLHDARRCVLRK